MRLVIAVIALAFSTVSARAEEQITDAKIHYQAGASYYEKADFLAAMREFNEAYRLSHRGALLFNIAQCEEKLEMWSDALASFRAYLEVPESEKDRALVKEKIARLEALAAKEPKPLAPPPATPAPPPTAKTPIAPIALVAGGAVLLAASLVTGLVAHAQYADLAGKCGPGANACPAGFQSERDLGSAMGVTSDVLLVGGVIAAAVGGVLFFVTREKPAKVSLLPSAGGLTVRF